MLLTDKKLINYTYMAVTIQLRGDTLANWNSANPVLLDREVALIATNAGSPKEYDAFVVGDGVSTFKQLYEGKSYNIPDGSITTPKLANGAVTSEKIADNSIFEEQLAQDSVGELNIKLRSIYEKHIADKQITLRRSSFARQNYFQPNSKVKWGYSLNHRGEETSNANYCITDYIPFGEAVGITQMISSVNGKHNLGGQFVWLYTIDKQLISGSGVMLNAGGGAISMGNFTRAYYVRFSINYKGCSESIMVEEGNTVGTYIPFVGEQDPELDVTVNGRFMLKDNVVSNGLQLNSSLGSTMESTDGGTASSRTIFTLNSYPYFLKKGNCIIFDATFQGTSGTFCVGKGYNQYRGDWLEISTSQVKHQHYESGLTTVETVSHGLYLSTFIKVIMYAGNSGTLCLVLLTKEGGIFKHLFKNWKFEACNMVFFRPVSCVFRKYKLSAINTDFKCPIWIWGDSYVDITDNRWPGQLRNLGFLNFLLDGLAGQGSAAAYEDLLRALSIATPKYLVWTLGMNDTEQVFKENLLKVHKICLEKGITLIGATVPTIPTRDKTSHTSIVRNFGIRYIDFHKAVCMDDSGYWYPGYLYSDNMHPTELGAQVMATQVLTDFPELLQYGITDTSGSVEEKYFGNV
nr:MAG: Protein of unknown function (DUF459) [Bacteriophage sp.]